jgi:hypothetical protein
VSFGPEEIREQLREMQAKYDRRHSLQEYRFRERTDEEMDESSSSHRLEHDAYREQVLQLYFDWVELQLAAPCPAMAIWMAEMFGEIASKTPLVIAKAMTDRIQKQADSKEKSVTDQVKALLGQGDASERPKPKPSVVDDIFKEFPGLRDSA